jgi:hypothetical protein
MQKLLVSVVLALLAVACGGDAEPASSATASPQADKTENATSGTAGNTTAETSEAPSAETTAPTQPAATSEPSFDGPPAPDFELALSDGSSFRLSGEEKPIYMVFWAEW